MTSDQNQGFLGLIDIKDSGIFVKGERDILS